MFDVLVERLGQLLPGFGERLAIDSKGIRSAGKRNKHVKPDSRRDTDADTGVKEYKGTRLDGALWQRVKKWFGYKLHLLVDSTYEIPVNFDVTRASSSDVKQVLPLVVGHKERHPTLGERCNILSGDRGYDDTKTLETLYDKYKVKPVIDIRNCWREDGDEIEREEGVPVTRQLYT